MMKVADGRWVIALALVAGGVLVATAQVVARPRLSAAHRAAAERLVEAMRIEQAATEAAARVLLEMLAAEPAWRAHEDILADYIEERLGWDVLRTEVVRLYAETFSAAEIEELTRFYHSPTGRKLAAQSPDLALRMQAVARERLEGDLGILELRMKNRVLDNLLEQSAFAPDPEGTEHAP